MIHLHPILLTCAPWLYTTPVSSEPILPRQGNPQNIWVTVDGSGSARTVTPTVSAAGSKLTISGAPGHVTATSVYMMTTASGIIQTSTGMAPVATAVAGSGEGAFVACSNYQGWDEPFCLPRRGSVLRPGDTYYVTWDPSYFALASTSVSIQVRYSDNTANTTLPNTSSDAGYSVWAVDDDILTRYDRNGSDLVATLYLVYDMLERFDTGQEYHSGPAVTISTSAPSDEALPEDNPKARSKAVTIAVPVVVVVAVVSMVMGIFLLWRWRRNGCVSGFMPRRFRRRPNTTNLVIHNYGWPEDKNDRVELTNSGRTEGKNVFREEIRRQDIIRAS